MRHGIVATSVLALTLTLASWIAGGAPSAESGPVLAATTGSAEAPVPANTTVPADRAADVSTIEPPAVEADPSSADAAEFLAAINGRRASEDLPPLERHVELDRLARSWAATMGGDGSLRHSALIYDVVAGSWTAAGENVGYGPSAAMVFGALEASPSHLANMLNADYTAVGIGVVRVDGVVWTAHLFAG